MPNNECTKILVYCFSGKGGIFASQMLVDSGYKKIYNIQDGITACVNAGYPVVVNPNLRAVNYPKIMNNAAILVSL